MNDIIKVTKEPETYRDPRELIGNLDNTHFSVLDNDNYRHIVPNADTRLHILYKCVCWCAPIEHDNRLIQHYADDKRHLYTLGIKQRH